MTDNDQEFEEMLCIPKPKEENKNHDTRNFKVLAMAASQIGTLEWKSGSNPKVEEYLDYGYSKDNKDTGLRDEVPWCLDGQTEVCTSNGWIKFENLKTEMESDRDLKVLEFDPKTYNVNWTDFNYVEKDYEGPAYEINIPGRNLKFTCDAGHRMWGDWSSKGLAKKRLLDVKPISELQDKLSIPVTEGIVDNQKSEINDTQIKFLAAALADGNLKSKTSVQFHVSKPEKIEQLKKFGNYKLYKYKKLHGANILPSVNIVFHNCSWLNFYFDNKKNINFKKFKSFSAEQMDVFLKEYIFYDGYHKKNKVDSCITTTNKGIADLIQFFATCTGFKTSFAIEPNYWKGQRCRDLFRINLSKGKRSLTLKKSHLIDIEYSGKLYCVQVPKQAFIARGNGTVFVSGNCAGFVAWCMEKVEMGSTNSLMARSYEKWGVSSKLSPLPGDIVTFWRKSKKSGFGHVGFFVGWKKPNQVLILGGNQNDSVNVTAYYTSRLVDIRRSSKAGPYSAEEIKEIHRLADAIKDGHKISPEGSVV